MKGILKGGAWDGSKVEVPEPPPEYLAIAGMPEVVYRIADFEVQDGEGMVVVYSKK